MRTFHLRQLPLLAVLTLIASGVAEASVAVLDTIPSGSAPTWTYVPHDPCAGTRSWGETASPFDGSAALQALMSNCATPTCGSYFVTKSFNFGTPVDRQTAQVEFDGRFDLMGVISLNRAMAQFQFFSGATSVGQVDVGYFTSGQTRGGVPAGTLASGRWHVGMTTLAQDPDRMEVRLHARSCSGGDGKVTIDNIALHTEAAEPPPPTTTLTFRPGPGANNGSDEGGESGGKDTWDWRTDNPAHSNVNTGANPTLALWNSNCNGWLARSYLQFDVSSLPAAELVTGVKLVLYTRIGGIYGAQPASSTMVVQAVTAPWHEMTLTYNTRPPVAPTVEASVTLPSGGNPGFEGFVEIDITALYRSWRDGSRPNYGMMYSRSNTACENGNYNYTRSSDDADETKRPALLVTYAVEPEDTTAPEIATPAGLTAEATGPDGAPVSYTASANDDTDGAVDAECSPTSGSTFALGTTTVTCTATDAAGNTAESFFDVFVVDTVAPTLTGVPGNLSAEATGSAGAAVSWAAPTASDLVSGALAVTCAPASESTFALGTTKVTCSAADAAGNAVDSFFDVFVADTVAPALVLPADITTTATGGAGAAVSFTATASDAVSGSLPVLCAPVSGSTFAIGATTVSCSAVDAAGNGGGGSFTVRVVVTLDSIEALIRSWVSSRGVANSLIVKLRHGSLGAFENELRAISGKWLTAAQASDLLALASRL